MARTKGEVATLVDMIAHRAAHDAAQCAFTFDGQAYDFGWLWASANRCAADLRACGVGRGDRVALALGNGPDFFVAFYGIMRAGATAVPLFPGYGAARLLELCAICEAAHLIISAGMSADRRADLAAAAGRAGIGLSTPAQGAAPGAELPAIACDDIAPDDIAYVQYTSGSTGDPKGVQISHRNLLTNMRQMIDGMQITPADVFVSWLPVYHDMGLILKTLVPFYLGAALHLLPASLRDVSIWLRMIEARRGTFTAAPDFAYRMCLRRIDNPKDYDLRSLRVALNAAEPVRIQTIREFERRFDLPPTMVAAYGLAEATVGVSIWPPNRPPKVDANGHVSVGRGFGGVSLAIVEGAARLATGQIGEIAIQSTALPTGYLNNPAANRALWWDAAHVLSGDLGYLDAEGDLFVVGRRKNAIKVLGRTIYPQEVQEVVDQHPAVRFCVPVGIDLGRREGEQLCVFAEVSPPQTPGQDALADIAADITARFHAQLGYRPGRLVLLVPGAIPLTYNGKVRVGALREAYLRGDLRRAGQIAYPPGSAG